MTLDDAVKGKVAYLLVIGLLAAVFFGGYWTRGYLDHSGVVSDTTAVVVKPPDPQTTTNIPGKPVPPKIVYRDRLVPDSSALWESAWLQNENARLSTQLDSMLAEKDSLRSRLEVLLAPHTATSPFSFTLLEGSGYLKGTAEQAYVPMTQQFGLKLTPTELTLPVVTNTKRPAWWVKPAVFVGGAATAYFITEKNSTGALISGGITLIPIIVEF